MPEIQIFVRGLDGRHYEDVTDVANPEELLVIVNKYNRLDPAYAPEGRVSVSNVTVRAEAGAAYREMEQAAGAEGLAFIAQSGYRSYDYQNQLYTNYKATDPGGADTYSARPGFSEHQTGLAIDLNLPSGGRLENFVGTKQAAWVAENAHLYGFIVRYTEENKEITGYISEPWHVRYIGPAHAGRMKAEGISSFEEYWVKFIRHQPPGEGLGAGGRTS
jgi:D-alanyl-D-alanine carboxypeptidase